MAAPSYATDLTNIILEMPNTTGWTLISDGGGGANNMTAPETDDFIQGNNCISRNPWTSANIRGMLYNSSQTISTDDAFYIWAKSDVTQALDTIASGGLQVCIGSGTSAFKAFYVDGSDTAVKGGWICYAVDPTTTASTTVGSPTSTTSYFGFRWSVATSGPNKGYPYKQDCLRQGRSCTVTAGDSGTPASWDALATYADDGTRRWGIVQETDTGARVVGIVNWGDGTTACYSRQTGSTIVFQNTRGFTSTSFTQVKFFNATSDIQWDGVTFQALGTANRGKFISDPTTDPPVILDACNFIDIDTFEAESNTDLTNCLFDSCNEVTVDGGSIVGSSFLTPTVAADSAAVKYNNAADPDGEFDNTTFSKGTNAHHAIEFGTSAPTTMTLRGIDFSGFSATDDLNDSTLNFLRTSGTTTLNLVDCTGNISIKTTGTHTVTKVINPVTTKIIVKTTGGTPIQNARVYVEAGDNTAYPYRESVTITRSGSTASVSHTAHGLADGDQVFIEGATQEEYNGVFAITNVTTNAYDYTVTGSPTSPATGTITSTWNMFEGDLTDVNGEVSDTRSYTADQPIFGRVRKSSASPYYKTATFTGTVDSANGVTINVQMILDE